MVDKPIVWLHGQIKSPPLRQPARIRAGFLLRLLQQGINVSMPDSRPIPDIGRRCHELRIPDGSLDWRIVYRIDPDSILILEVFSKKTQKTPKHVIESCKRRIAAYDALKGEST
ncbi:MAG: type II toxin-antitoxin system RelE/ParE family toxin [Ignavibacteriae bacterium]|nr:MAG: type II toxin-antitoxin system RelE/ParE family toxin [Ignavibacteriota bacterium]